MSILDLFKIVKSGAPRITLYGKPGIGKTTLASEFPTPFFISTEDSECPGIVSTPVLKSYIEVWNVVNELLSLETLPFKTIVIDSISKLDDFVVDYSLSKSPDIGRDRRRPETLAEAWGGYGAGYEKAASLHSALKHKMDKFKERGICAVYIGHSEIKKFKSFEFEDYDMLSISMNSDKSRRVYIDDVDAVLYCKQKTNIIETESKRAIAISSGNRFICPYSSDAHVSKNRFKIDKEINMSFEELKKYIPFFNEKSKEVK